MTFSDNRKHPVLPSSQEMLQLAIIKRLQIKKFFWLKHSETQIFQEKNIKLTEHSTFLFKIGRSSTILALFRGLQLRKSEGIYLYVL